MLDKPHHCPDWDFLFIRPGDPEMGCCLCGEPDQHSEETRREALYDHEREKEDERCSTCRGTGTVNPLTAPTGFFCASYATCPNCEGTGRDV